MSDPIATPPPAVAPASTDSPRLGRLRALLENAGAYALLCAAAAGTAWSGRTTLPAPAAWLLPGAFWLCQAALVALAASPRAPGWPRARWLAVQAALAIAGSVAYTALYAGGGELAPWFFVSAVLLVAARIPLRTFEGVAAAALLAYGVALALRALQLPLADLPPHELFGLGCAALVLTLAVLHAYRGARVERHLRRALDRAHAEVRVLRMQSTPEALARSYRRQHVASVLEKEKARADRTGRIFSVCMLDLEPAVVASLPGGPDDLEVVRERLGDRTRTLLRASDTLARTRYRRPFGRAPQEEFLAVLPDTRLAQAQLCAERITRSVRARIGGRDEPVRLAAGIAEYRAGDTIADVLRRAEQALHAAQQLVPGTVLGGESGSSPPRPPHRPKLRVVR